MSDKSNVWMDIKKLVVVFQYHSDENYKEYRSALDNALNESNVVNLKIIVVIPKSLKKETLTQHRLIHFLSPNDINFFGKIKDENLASIFNQKYDTLLCLEIEDKKTAKLLSKLGDKWKIGVNTSFDFFAIQVDSNSNNPFEIVNFAKNLLVKIS